jgi:hypothetical protein
MLAGSTDIAGDNFSNIDIPYQNASNNNNLTIATSTDGVNFTRYPQGGGLASDPAIASDGSSTIWVAWITGSSIEVMQCSAPVISCGQPFLYSPGIQAAQRMKPALLYVPGSQNSLYLAWEGPAFDQFTGTNDGQWINVAISQNGGQSFVPAIQQPGQFGFSGPVSTNFAAASGPSMTLYNGSIYLSYIDSESADPHMFTASVGSAAFTEQQLPPGIYAGDPAIVSWQNLLYEGYRSFFSEDNLWMTQGSGGYTNPTMYGMTLTDSPSFATVGGQTAGTLYYAQRTNFPGDGQYLWLFSATAALVQPAPEDKLQTSSGGGTGGGGGGGTGEGAGSPNTTIDYPTTT